MSVLKKLEFEKFERWIWIENLKGNTMSLSKNKEFCFCPGCKDQNRELKLTCEDCKLAKYCSSECQSIYFVDHMKGISCNFVLQQSQCVKRLHMNEGELLKAKGFNSRLWLVSMGTRNFGIIFYPQFKNPNFFSMKITSFCNSAGPDTHLLGNMDQIVMFCDAWLFH